MAEDPGKAKVGDLVKGIKDGMYVIPYFQRGYEWDPSMVSDLFESILQDYYAGLLLFWELDATDIEGQKWDPVWGADNKGTPDKAILDGQQRLSSLYYAIQNPEKKFPNRKSYYRWFLNLDKALNEEFEESIEYTYSYRHIKTRDLIADKTKWLERGVIPLAVLADPNFISSSEFESWLQTYVEDRNSQAIIPEDISALRVSNMIQRILNYEFITTTLNKDRKMFDICNIFARINKKGMRLSTFDLMNAFLYPHGISLRKNWEGLDNPTLKSIDSNMDEYILKLISLHLQGYCSSKYIYNLIPGESTKKKTDSGQMKDVVLIKDAEEFSALWTKACKYAEKAREIIMNVGSYDYGAIKSKFIPNTTILPVLGAVLWENENPANVNEFNDERFQWYWAAVFSADYSGSSDSVMSKDFRDWQRWLAEKVQVERISRVDKEFIKNELDFQSINRGAQYNAVLCIIALEGAKDFFVGRPLATGDFIRERINDHHIFPSKVKGLDERLSAKFESARDSIVNKTLLFDDTNISKISNKLPSEYLNEMIDQGIVGGFDELVEFMRPHLISKNALEFLLEDDFDGFIIEREKTLKDHILRLVS